jgi:hypothetical protein
MVHMPCSDVSAYSLTVSRLVVTQLDDSLHGARIAHSRGCLLLAPNAVAAVVTSENQSNSRASVLSYLCTVNQ